MTPHLEKFILNCGHGQFDFNIVTLSSCPVLKELEIYTESSTPLFSTPPAFPIDSISKLTSLTVCFNGGHGNHEIISSVLRANKSTLKFLNLWSSYVDYSELEGAIEALMALETLKIERLEGVPRNFLQLISSTIQTLDVPLERQHLEHYRQFPRPSMSINDMILDCWESYQREWITWEEFGDKNYSISKSLSTLRLDAVSGEELADVHDQIKEYKQPLLLKSIIVSDRDTQGIDCIQEGRIRDFFVSCFEALGVHLEFDY